MHIKKWVFSATLAASLLAVTNTPVHAQSKLEKRHNEWVFIYNNTIQTKFTGLVQHSDKQWYFVQNGKINWKFTGLAQHQTNKRWFFVKNGKIDWKFTGLAQHQTNKRWFFVKNGEIDWKFTGLVQHQTNKRWFFVKNGEIDWKFTGLKQHTNKNWYFVQNGEINWLANTVVKHTDNNYYSVKNGKMNGAFNGTQQDYKRHDVSFDKKNSKMVVMVDNKIDTSVTKVIKIDNKLVYFKNGVADLTFTGQVKTQKGFNFKVINGILQENTLTYDRYNAMEQIFINQTRYNKNFVRLIYNYDTDSIGAVGVKTTNQTTNDYKYVIWQSNFDDVTNEFVGFMAGPVKTIPSDWFVPKYADHQNHHATRLVIPKP